MTENTCFTECLTAEWSWYQLLSYSSYGCHLLVATGLFAWGQGQLRPVGEAPVVTQTPSYLQIADPGLFVRHSQEFVTAMLTGAPAPVWLRTQGCHMSCDIRDELCWSSSFLYNMDSHLSGGTPWMQPLPSVPRERLPWGLWMTWSQHDIHLLPRQEFPGSSMYNLTVAAMPPAIQEERHNGSRSLQRIETGKCWRNPGKERCTPRALTINFGPIPFSHSCQEMKYGCSNISGGPLGEFTKTTLQVDSPSWHLLSDVTYQAFRSGGCYNVAQNLAPGSWLPWDYIWVCLSPAVFQRQQPTLLPSIPSFLSLSHKSLPFLGAFLLRLYCFLCWYFYGLQSSWYKKMYYRKNFRTKITI